MSTNKSDRWNRAVNVAIIVTLAILLFGPSGPVVRGIGAVYSGWNEQRRVSRHWDDLVSAPSRLGEFMPSSGRAVIVEFVDYDCQVCQEVAPAVLEATRGEGVSVVVRHVPSNRSGSGATEAALAAICAEGYNRFPEAHEALISDQTWLSERDWVRFGKSLGIADSESFPDCMNEDATRNRLARDVELAGALQILGTPTFVSSSGLHPGAPGLTDAMGTAERAFRANGGRRIEPPQPSAQAPLRTLAESTFDSSDNPNLSELSVVVAGFFLPGTGFALVEQTEVLFVDPLSGETRVFGREGAGPREFRRIARALRTPRGLALWDILRRRVVFLDHDGEFLHALRHHAIPFNNPMGVAPVAVHPDGSIVFGDRESSESGYRGRTWESVQYVAAIGEDGLQVVAEAKGNELYYGERYSGGVIFGHWTLAAGTSDHFVIAETDLDSIGVFDWSGKEVIRIPMPTAVRPSAAQVRVARESKAAVPSRMAEAMSKLVESGVWGEESMGDIEDVTPFPIDEWPQNETAPAIDSVLTDFDERLWVRDYRFPDQDSVTWRVWDIERAKPLFTARLKARDRLLDARGDFVLVSELDEFDVPRAVVSQLRPAPVQK
ncbi:MAG: thioredoxin domain-containing protein [Gemmatimonadetes bacterium]|nr:thioredoxin domain-containing protein [Gemmatimonadota bacterium]